jgi:hypothetical protein
MSNSFIAAAAYLKLDSKALHLDELLAKIAYPV